MWKGSLCLLLDEYSKGLRCDNNTRVNTRTVVTVNSTHFSDILERTILLVLHGLKCAWVQNVTVN